MSVLGACVVRDVADPPPTNPPSSPEGLAALPTTPDLLPVLEPVHLIGRFDLTSDRSSAAFAWSGSAIWTRFAGTELKIDLSGSAWYDVEVDGVAQPAFATAAVRQHYTVVSGLADGEHDVRVTRRTEAFLGVSRFYGFVDATLIDTEVPAPALEIIGEAATAGWGVLGTNPTCPFSAATEAETHAWGAIAARTLGVAHTTIAYSGRGVQENSGGSTIGLVPELYERALPDDADNVHDFASQPAVVVLNVGGADFWQDDPGQPFVDAYLGFVEQVRGHYPQAEIIVSSSPVLRDWKRTAQIAYLKGIVDDLTSKGDDRISFLELEQQQVSDHYGCGYQPSPATQSKMADALVARIQALAVH